MSGKVIVGVVWYCTIERVPAMLLYFGKECDVVVMEIRDTNEDLDQRRYV